MKICFAVCEYNPFHNGHLRHLEMIGNEIKPDCIAVLMSGNFTQRGEIAILDKYTRAEHAVKAGADIVFELPTVFATAPAEIFAKGSVKLIKSVEAEKILCFGTESAEKKKLIATAAALSQESKEFRALMREELKKGVTQIRAKVNALSKMNISDLDFDLLKSPNNILGIEYTKAILASGADIDVYPVIREGSQYNDETLTSGNPSALAVRNALKNGSKEELRQFVPDFVFDDLPDIIPDADDLIFYSAMSTPKEQMKRITDCSEGLENSVKALVKTCKSLDELKRKLKTKRYTYTRISRILLSCLLQTDGDMVKKCLRYPLYLKVLAVKKEKIKLLSYFDKYASLPLITRKSDVGNLCPTAKACFDRDVFANDVYNFVTKKHFNEYDMKIV